MIAVGAPTDDMKQRLADLRRLLGWSQRRLAKELRVTPAAVSQWESGRRAVPGPVERLVEIYENNLGLLDPTARARRSAPRSEMASRLEGASLSGLTSAHTTASEIKAAAQLALTQRLARALGGLKGLPMKLGQLVSQLHFAVPAPVLEAMRMLEDRAPAVSEREIAAVVTSCLGKPPERVFARWDRRPFAAASIGQVHRAALADGTELAVKVQYPKIKQAIERDLAGLSAIRAFVPAANDDVLRELRDRVLEECDYAHEADGQEELRAIYAGIPGIVIPRVHREFSGDRVLAMDYIDGERFHDFAGRASQPERDRAGEIIFRFSLQSMLANGVFHADPHPGNYLFLANGDVAFLDFGCVKRLSPELPRVWADYARAVLEGRREEADAVLVSLGYISDVDRFDFEYQHELVERIAEPFERDTFRFSRHFVERNFRAIVVDNPNKQRISAPGEGLFLHRLVIGLYCVLGELEASASWGALLRELA